MNEFHYAVVVGINQYPSLQSLSAACTDAKEFYAWVTSRQGGAVPPDNVKHVFATLPANATAQEAKPTADAIFDAFDECKDAVRDVSTVDWPKTRLYFFGAGHGIAPEARDSALLAANVTERKYGYHVSCADLLEFFSRVQLFRELALFADCCRLYPPREVRRRPPAWTEENLDNGAVRKVLGCGAIFGRKAFEEPDIPPDQRRGYFTRALLDGLNGAPAAVGGYGFVTAGYLAEHVQEHMRRATERKFFKPLEADFTMEGGGETMTFGPQVAAAMPRTYPVTITISDPNVTSLFVAAGANGVSKPLQRRSSQPNVFEGRLPLGLYEAVPNGVSVVTQPLLFKVPEGGIDVQR